MLVWGCGPCRSAPRYYWLPLGWNRSLSRRWVAKLRVPFFHETRQTIRWNGSLHSMFVLPLTFSNKRFGDTGRRGDTSRGREGDREGSKRGRPRERDNKRAHRTHYWVNYPATHLDTSVQTHTDLLTVCTLVSDYSPLLSQVKMSRCCLRKSLVCSWRRLDPPLTRSLQSLCLFSPPRHLQQRNEKDQVWS